MSEAIKNSINGKKILVYILEISLIVVHFMLYAFVLAFTYAAAEDNSDNAYVVSQIISIGYYVVVALVMFLITNNLMKKHLNLE